MKRWINIKKAFPYKGKYDNDKGVFTNLGPDTFKYASTAFKNTWSVEQAKPNIGGMEQMLEALDLELVGRHHSGIDDARNIAKIVLKLIECGFDFT